MKKETKKPWPTKAAMTQIYEKKLWGGDTFVDFYSGTGSHDSEVITPYIDVVLTFLHSLDTPITVCDLGCGDFNVGKEFVAHTKKYYAIDIVESLIERNKIKFNATNLEFQCLDIAKDTLPDGDCAIIRQVLQHLSNAEIQKIVTKLSKYKYVIITEHVPKGAFTPNKDIISGQGIRLKKQSGVHISAPPFNFKTKREKPLLITEKGVKQGIIVTTFYQVF
ncbi:class I SAM-dependent methyltransferase [Aquimarina agarivorans]|uniref:class I SAM-dependent methyltransferase n=1 Tax=Aquimarina agarivorans TaxID=980584 RepID=UPI000248F8B0|nr:class I SAM-dependent methyltransferase [Aquimarina agarivorans]